MKFRAAVKKSDNENLYKIIFWDEERDPVYINDSRAAMDAESDKTVKRIIKIK